MRANKLYKRPKAKNGTGRQVTIKHILVPKEVADELALLRDAYRARLETKVTYEQMFRRWIAKIARIDPDIPAIAESLREKRRNDKENKPSDTEIASNRAETLPWKLKYLFRKGSEKIEALPGDMSNFYCTNNGKNIGMSRMLNDGWVLEDEFGTEISWEQARQINHLFHEHKNDH